MSTSRSLRSESVLPLFFSTHQAKRVERMSMKVPPVCMQNVKVSGVYVVSGICLLAMFLAPTAWSHTTLTSMLFPSSKITLLKVVCMVLCMALTVYYWLCVDTTWTPVQQRLLEVSDESRKGLPINRRRSVLISGRYPIPLDSELFQGKFLVMSRSVQHRRRLMMQVQGQLKRPAPVDHSVMMALELPSSVGDMSTRWKWVLEKILKLVQTIVPGMHFNLDASETQSVHLAVPLYQCADEMVISKAYKGTQTTADLVAASVRLGDSSFGETKASRASRWKTEVGKEPFLETKVYSFQFTSSILDLQRWQIRLPFGLGDLPVEMLLGQHPIRLSAYFLPTSVVKSLSPHDDSKKKLLFSYSIRQKSTSVDSRRKERALRPPVPSRRGHSELAVVSAQKSSSEAPVVPFSVTPRVSPLPPRQQTSSQGTTFPLLQATSVRDLPLPNHRLEASQLDCLQFELSSWVERVDRVAGSRKVGYLLSVRERLEDGTYRDFSVLRSASTVKNALLLVDESMALDVSSEGSSSDQAAEHCQRYRRVFRKLQTEARSYLYDKIEEEMQLVSKTMQLIATSTAKSPVTQFRRAMLCRCLVSTTHLPPVSSQADIGVQTASKDIVQWSGGGYRCVRRQFLRQEWIVVTATELKFYRSFSLKADKVVALDKVLRVQVVDKSPVLCAHDNASSTYERQWFCIEVHLVTQVVTFFLSTDYTRRQCISKLRQFIESERVPAMVDRPLRTISTPLCLNQRSLLSSLPTPPWSTQYTSIDKTTLQDTLRSVQQVLTKALTLYNQREEERSRKHLLEVLDGVETLTCVDFGLLVEESSQSSASWRDLSGDKLAFVLNLYHLLYIHATLIVGEPNDHQEWKKLQSLAHYRLCDTSQEVPVKLTLDRIERLMLRRSRERLTTTHPLVSSISQDSAKEEEGRIPPTLVLDRPDFRTHLALQSHCSPGTNVMVVYDGGTLVQAQLNATCAYFLSKEMDVDDVKRVIYMPKVCEWNEAERRQSPSDVHESTLGMEQDQGRELLGSPEFLCLQKLRSFMDDELHHQVQHLLLGSGEEPKLRYRQFWTQSTRRNASDDVFGQIASTMDATVETIMSWFT